MTTWIRLYRRTRGLADSRTHCHPGALFHFASQSEIDPEAPRTLAHPYPEADLPPVALVLARSPLAGARIFRASFVRRWDRCVTNGPVVSARVQ